MLLLHQRLKTLQHAPGALQLVVAFFQPGALEHLDEHESIPGRARIDRQGLAAQLRVRAHLGDGDKAQEPGIAAHYRLQIAPEHGFLALPFAISDEVVDRGHCDVELAVDEVGELEHRAHRGRHSHLDPVLREQPLLLRHPDRPVEAAGEDDEVDGLGRGGLRNRAGGDKQRDQPGHQLSGNSIHVFLHRWSFTPDRRPSGSPTCARRCAPARWRGFSPAPRSCAAPCRPGRR